MGEKRDSLKERALTEWLALRSQQGDQQALQQLIGLWRPRYLAYVRTRVGDPEAANDIVQEGLISLCRSLGRLRDLGAFVSWSYRIMERRCADWLRAKARDSNIIEFVDQLPETSSVLDSERVQTSLTVATLLATLDGKLAGTLRLYYLEELSVSDIAAIYKVPPGTIKSRLYYARKYLQDSQRQAGNPVTEGGTENEQH